MFSRLTFLLSLLKALSASTNSRHSLLSSSKLFLTACIAASMPDSSPAHVCCVHTASCTCLLCSHCMYDVFLQQSCDCFANDSS